MSCKQWVNRAQTISRKAIVWGTSQLEMVQGQRDGTLVRVGFRGNDFGYLVGGDGCCQDAGEFPLGGNLR